LFAYTDNAGGLYRQEWHGTSWLSSGIKSTAVLAAAMRPTLFTMNSGEFDLVSAYVAQSSELQAATRTAKDHGSIWSSPGLVTSSPHALDGANGVGLANGRAMLVFRDSEKKAWFTVFDPSKDPKWSTARALVIDGDPALASTPQLVQDTCGAEATLVYVEEGGRVGLLRYADDAWSEPFVIPKLSKLTYATVVAAP
jgi:hypothetical protein